MEVTATEAKNRFGQVLDACQREPVFIGKSGRRHGVLLSPSHYAQLCDAARPALRGPEPSTAGEFYALHKEWVDDCNARVERDGLWNDDFRTW